MVDHATCDGDNCFGVFAPDLVDGLAAFLVAGVGDGAGVYDIDVGGIVANGNLIASSLEARSQSVCFIQVDAAA